ncbi:MAG: magnesium chelatase [Thermoprotei archaeon]|nr:MAG: magnesium chelatase [Thermoprotei archaeon]
MKLEEVSLKCKKVLKEVGRVIVGKEEVVEKLLLAILSDGHVLIEDYPGLAKTLMAKTLARTLSCEFKRVQFTPDLLPADITGTYVYNQKTMEFEFRKGPVFTNILLADEINRAPPKTQSALLEAMQEKQVTVDGTTYRLKRPFIVIATQNPIEYEGVYPLPEAQIDRFLMKLKVGFPNRSEEIEILKRRLAWKSDVIEVKEVVDLKTLIDMQKAVEEVYVDDKILEYIVDITRATREHPRVELGVSPRGTVFLMKLARAKAAVEGRDYVVPDDVKYIAVEALAHRIILKTELWIKGVKVEQVVRDILEKTPVPKGY